MSYDNLERDVVGRLSARDTLSATSVMTTAELPATITTKPGTVVELPR